jgi:tetratricopeptide (TPR) repeat protein
MIELAMVSGRENTAFLYEDQEWYSYSEEGRLPAHSSQVHRTVNGTGEYTLLREVTEEQVKDSLVSEKRKADALFLILATLDVDVSISNRVVIAELADDLLANEDTRFFVLKRILSWPLPPGISGHRRSLMEIANSFPQVGPILHRIFDAQPLLHEISHLWLDSAKKAGVRTNVLAQVRSELIDSGFFSAVLAGCLSAESDRTSKVHTAIVSELVKPNASQALKAVLREFQSTVGSIVLSSPNRRLTSGRLFKKEASTKENVIPKVQVSAYEAMTRVQKQLSSVKSMLFMDKIAQAERYALELLDFKLGQNDRHFAVVSLCNLTASALDANQFAFAETLINSAMNIDPTDEVVFTSRAEVYKRRGHFAAALQAYEEAIITFPYSTWSLDGKADVLREMGRFDESIALYLEVQKNFPDNPVAFNGHVSVLRSQGKQIEALQVAVANAKRFPQDAVTRGTLAAALAANGKYKESARQFEQAHALDHTNHRFTVGAAYSLFSSGQIRQALAILDTYLLTSSDVYVQAARAQILRMAGRTTESKTAYQAILKIFPRYAPARLGLLGLDVLANPKMIAQTSYELDNPESEQDWMALRAYLIALIGVGEGDLAIEKISKLIPLCPWLRERVRLNSVLGIAQMRGGDAKCIETLQTDLYLLDDSNKQARLLLLSHAQMQQNRPRIARVLLTNLVTTKEPFLWTMKQNLLAVYRNAATPQQRNDIAQREIELALAA